MAKIDLGRIEGYANMTPEQKLARLKHLSTKTMPESWSV